MLNKSYKSFLGLAVGLFALLSLGACVDQEFDTPSPRALTDVVPADSQYKNIGTLKNMYESYIQKNPNKLFWRVEENIALKAVISMDGKTSNIYKQVFIQDPAGQTDAVQGMALAVTGSNPYTQGNLIHINLKGNVVTKKNGLYQIGGDYFADYPKDPDHPKGSKVQAINSFEKVFWEKSSVELAPKTLTIAQIKSNKNNQGILVKIEDARFLEDDKKTFSEAPQKDISYPFVDHKLKDATGVIEVKTSKFANFRDELVPTGQGTFIGVIGYFDAKGEENAHQLYIRSPKELNMKGAVTPVEPVKPVNPGSGEYVGKTTS
ncbi:MAG: DUF5689 domain-containing protein, partial [Cytophagales bacterium]|nr:DUF5689 domain-containing protein [Cytophagales bacterium]